MNRHIVIDTTIWDTRDREAWMTISHDEPGYDGLYLNIGVKDAEGRSVVRIAAKDLFDAVDVLRELEYTTRR